MNTFNKFDPCKTVTIQKSASSSKWLGRADPDGIVDLKRRIEELERRPLHLSRARRFPYRGQRELAGLRLASDQARSDRVSSLRIQDSRIESLKGSAVMAIEVEERFQRADQIKRLSGSSREIELIPAGYFRDQTIVIGTTEALGEASFSTNAFERSIVRHPSRSPFADFGICWI